MNQKLSLSFLEAEMDAQKEAATCPDREEMTLQFRLTTGVELGESLGFSESLFSHQSNEANNSYLPGSS